MRLQILMTTLVLAVTLIASGSSRADLIYTFSNHLSDQSGHTLFGTIRTTDTAPNDGSLLANEILGWSFTMTGPNATSASSTDQSSYTIVNGDVSISATEITLAAPNVMSSDIYSLIIGSGTGRVVWYREDDFGATNDLYEATGAWSTPFPSMSNTDPWQIATLQVVPEPSSFSIIGIAGLAWIGIRRKRRSS